MVKLLAVSLMVYGNREKLLLSALSAPNRTWYQAGINYQETKTRGNERLFYSNDGLLYFTRDHSKTVTPIGRWK
ncbi:ribonuclease domain-containing protein [Paralysiella testudinis]|uniref:Uncharacterized protein n=1 Tax=Paralysiella testudinis TaxID=2809020 RepID=A0A892ZMY3_9NEIS|nr:hypothetical protein JQU52_01915 [Paralysiella testudinis]